MISTLIAGADRSYWYGNMYGSKNGSRNMSISGYNKDINMGRSSSGSKDIDRNDNSGWSSSGSWNRSWSWV